jgi:isopentenyl-diphosphate delta-isomerase
MRLRQCGVRYVDVSGAGGTSWVRVEALRGDAAARAIGDLLAGWGIPTAASLAMLRGSGLTVIASGGLRNGLDLAKSLALGATIGGAALPMFRACRTGGSDAVVALVEQWVSGLRAAMLLTGSATLKDLRRQPVVLGLRIRAWIESQSPARRRK